MTPRRALCALALAATLGATSGCRSGQPAGADGPVIVLAFDGISMASLTRDDVANSASSNRPGAALDAERFPRLADLASRSTVATSALAPSDQADRSFAAVVETGLCALLDGREVVWDDACGGGTVEVGDDRAARFRRFLESIRAAGAGGYVLRSSLPDTPWQYLADGDAYHAPLHEIPGRYGEFWGWSPSLVEQGRRRHEEQLRFVDSLVGALLDRLERLGLSERATIIVFGTRGVSFRPGEKIRHLSEGNADDILRVPVVVHAPGQVRGRVVDQPIALADLPARMESWLARDQPGTPEPAGNTAASRTVRVGGLHHAPFALDIAGDSYRLAEPTPPPGASLVDRDADATVVGAKGQPAAESSISLLPDAGVFLHGVTVDADGTVAGDDVPVMLAGRLHGVPGFPPTLRLEIDGRQVDRVRTYGPRNGDHWFSFLRRPEWRLDEVGPTVRLALLLESAEPSEPLPVLAPVATTDVESAADCGLAGFAEGARGIGDEIFLTGRVSASRMLAVLRVEVYDADRLLYSRSLDAKSAEAANDAAEGRRFEIRLPVALAPRWQTSGLRLAAVATGCRRAWLSPLHTVTLRGLEVESVADGTGQTAHRRPGALAGAVEQVGERWGGVLLAGWAADLDAGRPADRIVVLRGDRVVSEQPLAVTRPDLVAYFDDPGRAGSGFEFVVEPGSGELRVVAIRGRDLTTVPVLRAAGHSATVRPVSDTPKIEGALWRKTLYLDEHRNVPVSRDAFGTVENVRETGHGWIVEGWAGDVKRGDAATRVYVLLDAEVVATAQVNGSRDDVASATGVPALADSGFRIELGGDVMPSRRDDLRFVAVSVGGRAGTLQKREGLP